MDIEIIGENENSKKQCSCKNCGAVLRYLPVNITSASCRNIDGSYDTNYWIICPRCKYKIYVTSPGV